MARRRLVVFLLATVMMAIGAAAQSDTAQLSGYVKDATGAVVPNAAVTLRHEGTGVERKTQSNPSGYYVLTNIPPGTYTLAVEAPGFRRFQKTQNRLDPSMAASIDADLQVGMVAETVEVVASAVNLQTDTATLGRLVQREQIENINLNGRNPIFLALTKPGVRGGSLAGRSFGLSTGGFSINGSRGQENLITYDGAVGIRTRQNGESIGTADLDSVQEVQVLTLNYNAEYGRSVGGQIRIVTRSGASKFHGSVFESFRNSAVDANSWTRNRNVSTNFVAPFRYNQFGYNFSGPIYIPGKFNTDKNKLFFFWGQEWVRFRQDATNEIVVPSLAMRRGDFSELLGPNPFFTGTTVIRDPTTGQPFPGNIIPTGRLSRNGIGLLNAYSEPTPGYLRGRNNKIGTGGAPINQRKDTLNIDYNASEKHQIRFRHANFKYFSYEPFFGGTDRAPRIFDRPNKTASVNWIYTINARTVNELLVSASVDRVFIGVDTSSGRFDRTKYGLNYAYLFPERKEIPNKIPTITIANFQTVDGGPYPAKSAGPIYNISDNLTRVVGNHTLKAGIMFERSGQNDFDQIPVTGNPGSTNNQNGRFVFSNARPNGTGLAIANAALGLFDTYAEVGPRAYSPYRGAMWEWYVQDSWKVTPKLRLELGLRHTIIQPYYSLWRNMSVFDPRLYDPSKAVQVDRVSGRPIAGTGDPLNGVAIPGSGFPDSANGRVANMDQLKSLFKGLPKQYQEIRKKDFQPRVGIAYSFNPRTVVRAGAGRFISRLGVSDSIFLGGNPPFQPQPSVENGIVDNPGGTAAGLFAVNMLTFDRNNPNPEAYGWNVTVERELPLSSTVEVSYVGRRGLHQQRERNINQLAPGTVQANAGVNANFLRPYKGFGQIRISSNEANSLYQGLQIGYNRRFHKGVSWGVAYTYSKTSDNGSGHRDVLPNAFDARNIWGPADFDTRHVAVINWIWELPFWKDRTRLRNKLLGGWQINGVTQFQTGTPGSVATGDDFAGVGAGSGSQFWVLGSDISYPKQFTANTGGTEKWVTATATRPTAGTFNTQSVRNTLYAPGFQNWNLGLTKDFFLTEAQKVQFRFEAFNWINHPNLGGATGGGLDRSPTSATFGQVTSKGSERNLQFTLRYSF